jgi:hypothetical protein
MAEKNRQYSIRLRNGEQEIEVHHNPEFISDIFYQFLPGLRNSFSKTPGQTEKTLLSSETEKNVIASLPEGSLKKDEERAADMVKPTTEESVTSSKTSPRRKGIGGRINKAEREEMTKVIAGHFEGEHAYQDVINKTEDAETRALLVLYMAGQHFNIRGFSAGQLATILKERFKQPVPRQTIQAALNKGKLAIKEGSKYIIMQSGIDKVKQVLEETKKE